MNKFLFVGSLMTTACSLQNNFGIVSKDENVLFIIVDDLNTTLKCYNHHLVKTPNIDRLAARGVIFKHAYCNFSVSNPSRSSMLTGLKPETTTILNNQVPIKTILGNRITLPALFRENGFYTMSLGKVFNGQGDHNDPDAWDEIYEFGTTELGKKGEGRNITGGALQWCDWKAAEGSDADQPDGQIAAKAVELIKNKRDKPFFLAVGFHKPHDPFVAPKKYFDMYPIDQCNPPVLPDSWAPPYPHTLPQETKVFNLFTDQDKREFLRSYYACVTFMDAQVGKILDALEETKLIDNTLIIFMGDNGYHLGEHNWWNKVTIYEKGTNVPLIISGQVTTERGVISNAIVELLDIYPTLASLFNLKNAPKYLEGKDFSDVLRNPSIPFRNAARSIITRGSMIGRTVRTSEWRYTEWDGGNKGCELYDEIRDPLEYFNLAQNQSYAGKIAELKKLLNQEN